MRNVFNTILAVMMLFGAACAEELSSERLSIVVEADLNGDQKHDRVVISADNYQASESMSGSDLSKCRLPVVQIYLSSKDKSLMSNVRTSAPFIRDCVSSPVSYELRIKRSIVILTMLQETSGLRIDAKFRFNKSKNEFQLIGIERYVISADDNVMDGHVSINFLTKEMMIYYSNGKKSSKKITSRIWSICCFESDEVYFSEFQN